MAHQRHEPAEPQPHERDQQRQRAHQAEELAHEELEAGDGLGQHHVQGAAVQLLVHQAGAEEDGHQRAHAPRHRQAQIEHGHGLPRAGALQCPGQADQGGHEQQGRDQ